MTEQLQNEAGTNPLQDREYVGYIKAVKDILLVSLDEFKETE